jgi:hypothetical protein
MASVTVFTFGDSVEAVCREIGADLRHYCEPPYAPGGGGVSVLGESYGSGTWFGDLEFCGSLVVEGVGEGWAVRVASFVAGVHGQDAVGVVHNPGGRTLAVPGDSHGLRTSGEVWGA